VGRVLLSLVVLCLCNGVFGGGSSDPELKMTTTQIINYWGYPAEEHSILTDDNYILTLHRIPYGKTGQSAKRPVIFLQHGLEDCSVSWVINLPDQSAGFIFADAGFDIWMGNMRGNTYSRDHLTLDPTSHEFWKFTFDDMAEFDLSAQINYVLKSTNQSSLYYVGHSQGTLTMFAKLAEDQEFAKKIKQFHALAPVGQVTNIQGLFEVVAHYLYQEIELFYFLFGDGQFLPTGDFMTLISQLVCKNFVGAEFCDDFVMLIFGVDSNQLNVTRTSVYMSHIPAGTSTMNVLHWVQMVRSGLVSKYDFGIRHENKEKYGEATPPLYDFSKVNADMYLYWSPKDWVADEKDIEDYLLKVLPKEYIKENNKLDDFNHVDFLWGKNAAEKIYKPILNTIQNDLTPK